MLPLKVGISAQKDLQGSESETSKLLRGKKEISAFQMKGL